MRYAITAMESIYKGNLGTSIRTVVDVNDEEEVKTLGKGLAQKIISSIATQNPDYRHLNAEPIYTFIRLNKHAEELPLPMLQDSFNERPRVVCEIFDINADN